MAKNDFITKVQENIELNVSKKDLNEIFDGFVKTIKDTVVAGDSVKIPDVCTISSKDVPAKSGVTKLGGVEKPWSKPAHKEGCVKVAKKLKTIFE